MEETRDIKETTVEEVLSWYSANKNAVQDKDFEIPNEGEA